MSSRCIFVVVAMLAGCSGMPSLPSLTPYKMDIQQGNVVTQEMVSKLKAGMTRNQVRFILGTPLVVDPFRTDRWDYVYAYEKGGAIQEQRRIAVIFEGDKLVRIEGDVVPAAKERAVTAEKPRPAAAAAPKGRAAPSPPKPEPVAQPETGGASLVTGSGERVQSGGATAEAAAGAQPEKKDEQAKEEKPAEERGFFGRLLEKLGF